MTFGAGLVVNGRYKLLSKLGEGGFATVYLAEDLELGRQSAVKFLHADVFNDEEDGLRFQREAKLLGRLVHPNIVSAYAFGYTEVSDKDSGVVSVPYIVMELLEGESLSSYLKSVERLKPEICIEIFSQVAAGLEAAHQAGVIHRDLNSSNIFLVKSAGKLQVKLIDFGISHVHSDSSSTGKLTKTGFLMGTPSYMSPELAAGQKATVQSDIYSFGCVLYECLAGKLPFEADNPIGVLFKQRHEYPDGLVLDWTDKKMSAGFQLITLRCLQKEPEHRYQSFLEVENAISDIAQGVELHSPSFLHSWADGKLKTVKTGRSVRLIAAGLILLIAVAVLAYYRVAVLELAFQPVASLTSVSTLGLQQSYFELLQRFGSVKAPEMATKIARTYGTSSDFLSQRDWLLKAADSYFACKNSEKAMESLDEAIKVNSKISLLPQRVKLYRAAGSLLDKYQKESVSWFEVEARSQLVLQMSRDNYINGISRAYNEFLFRSDVYFGSSPDTAAVMEAVILPLERRQLLVSAGEEPRLSSLAGSLPFLEKFVHGELRNARYVKAALLNKGLSAYLRGALEMSDVQLSHRGDPAAEAKALIELKKRRSYSELLKFALQLRLVELNLQIPEVEKAKESALAAVELEKVLRLDLAPILVESLIKVKAKDLLNEFVADTVERLEITIKVHSNEKPAEQYVYNQMAESHESFFNSETCILKKMIDIARSHREDEIAQKLEKTLLQWQGRYHILPTGSAPLQFAANARLTNLSRRFYYMCLQGHLDEGKNLIVQSAVGSNAVDRDALFQICMYTSSGLLEIHRSEDSLEILKFAWTTFDHSMPFKLNILMEFIERYCTASFVLHRTINPAELKQIMDCFVRNVSVPGAKLSKTSANRVFTCAGLLVEASLWSNEMRAGLSFLLEVRNAAIAREIFDPHIPAYIRAMSILVSRIGSNTEIIKEEVKDASKAFVEILHNPEKYGADNNLQLRDIAEDLYIACFKSGFNADAQKLESEWRTFLEKRLLLNNELWNEFLLSLVRASSVLDTSEQLVSFSNLYLKVLDENIDNSNRASVAANCFLPAHAMQKKGLRKEMSEYLTKLRAVLERHKIFAPQNGISLFWYDCYFTVIHSRVAKEGIGVFDFNKFFSEIDQYHDSNESASARVVAGLHLFAVNHSKSGREYLLDAFERYKSVPVDQRERDYAMSCCLKLISTEPDLEKKFVYLREAIKLLKVKNHEWQVVVAVKNELVAALKERGDLKNAQALAELKEPGFDYMLQLAKP